MLKQFVFHAKSKEKKWALVQNLSKMARKTVVSSAKSTQKVTLDVNFIKSFISKVLVFAIFL